VTPCGKSPPDRERGPSETPVQPKPGKGVTSVTVENVRIPALQRPDRRTESGFADVVLAVLAVQSEPVSAEVQGIYREIRQFLAMDASFRPRNRPPFR
jgi:hypothetical protein